MVKVLRRPFFQIYLITESVVQFKCNQGERLGHGRDANQGDTGRKVTLHSVAHFSIIAIGRRQTEAYRTGVGNQAVFFAISPADKLPEDVRTKLKIVSTKNYVPLALTSRISNWEMTERHSMFIELRVRCHLLLVFC